MQIFPLVDPRINGITAYIQTLIDDVDAATARTTLGLGTGDSPTFTNGTFTGNVSVGSGAGTPGRLSLHAGAGGTPAGRTGGNLEYYSGEIEDETVKGYTFANTDGKHVWQATAPTQDTDVGVAWVDFDDGSASFAGGAFDIDASGNITDVGNITSDGALTIPTINAFTLGGKLTAGANEIEGSNFDINGGTIDTANNISTSANLQVINGAHTGTIYLDAAGDMNLTCVRRLQIRAERPQMGLHHSGSQVASWAFDGTNSAIIIADGGGIFTFTNQDVDSDIIFQTTDSGGTNQNLRVYASTGVVRVINKISFTQTDDNEYIDSLADGYMDYGATTAHRFNTRLNLSSVAGSITEGDIWNDSTQEALQTFVSGIEQTLMGVIFTQTADQTIGNTTTETTMFGTGVGTLTLPANFWVVGKTIRVEIHGDFADTGNPTAEVQVYYGATSLIDSGAITLSGLAGTEEWETEVVITCRSVGGSGTVETIIDWEYETTTGSSAIERLDVAGALQTIDTTASGALDVTFQWGTAAAANTIHSHVGFVEILN